MGVSAPIRPGDAFALCAAEVIGAAILVREIVELPVRWGIRLCPMDPATLAMVLGSPEDFLLQLANAEVNAHFHGTRWHPAAGSIHTSAKLPGAQACAEKAGLMTAGALLGARRFGVAGTLSLDEIFSPEQLLYDVEIRDQVQRLATGIDGTCDPERCAREVAEGVRQGGFAGLEATASLFRGVYWRPDLFERRFAAGWEGSGAGTIRDQVRERLRELTSMERRDPEPALRRELDRIVARAATAFGGGAGMSGGKR
jgi:trimethylamine:corrinoid methyltransferase-like protein